MKSEQLNLYINFCKAFRTSNLTEVGKMLNLSDPYHGAYQLFRAKQPNKYLAFAVKARIDTDFSYF